MKLKIEIDCGNDAFGEGELSRGAELGRILDKLAEQMRDAHQYVAINDTNGNVVGTAYFTE